MKKIALPFVLFLLVWQSLAAQTSTQSKPADNPSSRAHRARLEFMALPLVAYNHLYGGVRVQGRGRWEQVYSFSANAFTFWGGHLSAHLSANLNRWFRNRAGYFPFWFRASHALGSHYEEGTRPASLRFGLGTGLGTCPRLTRGWLLRMELGAGACLNFVEGNRRHPGYHLEDFHQNSQPPVLPALYFRLAFVRDPKD